MSTVYHEAPLSEAAKQAHRALASLTEELEATDWYNQRADVCEDPELKAILLHNRNEEIEHASMLLEYLRRTIPEFDAELKTYLFSTAPITEIEDTEAGGADEAGGAAPASHSGLGIGRLKK